MRATSPPHKIDASIEIVGVVEDSQYGFVTEKVPTADELAGNMNLLPKVDNAAGQLVEPTIYDPLTTCTNPAGCAGDPTKGANYGERLPFQGNQIPTNRINQASLNYLKRFYPISAVGSNSAYANFTANAPTGGQNFQTVARIDNQISDNQHISSRFTWWKNTNLPQAPWAQASVRIAAPRISPCTTGAR